MHFFGNPQCSIQANSECAADRSSRNTLYEYAPSSKKCNSITIKACLVGLRSVQSFLTLRYFIVYTVLLYNSVFVYLFLVSHPPFFCARYLRLEHLGGIRLASAQLQTTANMIKAYRGTVRGKQA